MAHPYRIFDVGDAGAGPPRGLPVARRRQHLADRRRPTPPRSTAAPAARCLGAQRDWRSPTGLRRRGPPPAARRPTASWTPCRARRRRSPDRRVTAVRPGGPARPPPTAAPRRRPRPAATPPPAHPSGSTSPGISVSRASSASPLGADRRRRRRDDHHRARPEGTGSTDDVGSKCSGPTTTASARPVRAAAPPARAASRSAAAAGRDRLRANRFRPAPPPAGAGPARHDRAVSARITASRSRPRIPTPGASPLPSGGRPFDGRYSGCGLSSTHGSPINSAASPPHAVITSDTTRSGARSRSRGTLSTAIRAARWWIFAPASVSSSASVGSSPSEFDGVHPCRAARYPAIPCPSAASACRPRPGTEGTAQWPERRARDRVRQPPRRASGLPCHSARPLGWGP